MLQLLILRIRKSLNVCISITKSRVNFVYTKANLAWGERNEIENVEGEKPRKRKRKKRCNKKMQKPENESQTGHGRF